MSETGEYLCEDGMRSLDCPCSECLEYQRERRRELLTRRDGVFFRKYGVTRKTARPGVKKLQGCIRRLLLQQASQRERAVVVLQRTFRVYHCWLMKQPVCPICTRQVRLTEDTPHASIHPVCRECMTKWRRTCRSNGDPEVCPMCRKLLPRPWTDVATIRPPSDSEESYSSDSEDEEGRV